MDRCAECGFDWAIPPETLRSEVGGIGARCRRAVLPLMSARPGEAGDGRGPDWVAQPADGGWSVIEYVAHLRDVTAFFVDRMQRVLAEDRPYLAVDATFAQLAEQRSYRAQDPAQVLDQLDDAAGEAERVLRDLDDEQWQRVGIGSGGDERTLLVLARRLAHEGHHHCLDIERILVSKRADQR